MADSYNKKERDKKRKKKKQDKAERKKQRLEEGNSFEFMYLDENGNLTSTPPDPTKKKEEVKLEDIRISTPKQSELDAMDTELRGTVKFFNVEKQFGFIKRDGSPEEYFVHEDNLIDKIRDNDKVSFELGTGRKGIVAINVKLITK